jgi:hypothetical protein
MQKQAFELWDIYSKQEKYGKVLLFCVKSHGLAWDQDLFLTV